MRRRQTHHQKVQSAAQLLMYKRHRQPGLKGWELKKTIGADYVKVLEVLDRHLEKLGLAVKTTSEEEAGKTELAPERLDAARFYVGLRNPPNLKDARLSGWRIDDIASLAVILAHIVTHEGKAPRSELEELLKDKMAEWRVPLNLDRFIRQGYIMEDDKGVIYLDWRTRAEVNLKELLDALVRSQPEARKGAAPQAQPTTAPD